MTSKMTFYTRIVAICFVGLTVLAAELSLAAFSRPGLKVKQPTKGAAVHRLAPVQVPLKLALNKAKASAESLDKQVGRYLQVSSMGSFERWRKNVNLEGVQVEYSQRVLAHLKAMADLMRLRREHSRTFKKLYEFDFQNLMLKSDYVLSVNTTRTALESGARNREFSKALEQAFATYNTERLALDGKMIAYHDP